MKFEKGLQALNRLEVGKQVFNGLENYKIFHISRVNRLKIFTEKTSWNYLKPRANKKSKHSFWSDYTTFLKMRENFTINA